MMAHNMHFRTNNPLNTHLPPPLPGLYSQSSSGSYSKASTASAAAGPSRLFPQHPSSFMDGYSESSAASAPLTNDPSFDILDWHPAYQSCQRYFLDHAQHEPGTQALCALINIRLPYQWSANPISSATSVPNSSNGASSSSAANNAFTFNPYQSQQRNGSSSMNSPNHPRNGSANPPPTFVSLVPYIRRLVITGFDKTPILHGFFGDDYARGVLPHLDCERRNYLFAAKHGGWRTCKKQYDVGSGGGDDETVPFMKPLDEAKIEELTAAEKAWSGWLAMEDWMVGPRAPRDGEQYGESGRGGAQVEPETLPDGVPEYFHRRQ